MESNNLTEKLNTFTSLVLKDAEQKREKLLENVQKEYSERIDAKENELLQGAYAVSYTHLTLPTICSV